MSKGPNLQPSAFSLQPLDWDAIGREAAGLLSQYIQFDTTNPPGNETPAIKFLADALSQRGFDPQILLAAPGRANLIVRLPAKTPAAPPILLYAHADVVPADPADWSVPPFSGRIENGFVWGRGALDDKGLGIIFLQALTLLKQHAVPLNRDIILLIAADEETCGGHGVAWLLNHHPELIRAEYVWDEGGMGWQQSAKNVVYHVAIAEKTALTLKLTALGTPGHASIPHPNNPHDRLVEALYRIKQWQQPARLTQPVLQMLQTLAPQQPFPNNYLYAHAQKLKPIAARLLSRSSVFVPLLKNGINLTVLQGGHASNVIPAKTEARLDVRLLPDENPTEFVTHLRALISGLNVTLEIENSPPPQAVAPLNTPFFQALAGTLQSAGPPGPVIPYLTPGATDSRFFRAAGMKAYGFMPMLLSTSELSRIHGIDERVSMANLQWGTQVVFETLLTLTNRD